ncbi:hypothetical protein PSTEL_00670 [Paenibacillus stellifer]|uniref:Uncharacterized protein n=1 Tax=Paenibacillus stellifer TaxID=169760 RepID=A0A089LP38_9BACL|nr:hypothetical protein [Paenibacillus stellifer]AIQ61860.1 hypothetical protein PSTEL_00670 [Paenibacillus stellifer]
MAGGIIDSLMYSVGFKFNNRGIRDAQSGVDRLTQRVEGMGRSIGRAVKSFGGLALAIGGVSSAASLFKKTIGGAMQLEQTQMQISALVGSAEKGQEVFDMINNMGLKSVFSEDDFLNAGKAFLPITKNVKELNYMLGVTERLASANPLEGMEGAAFSMKELASGDIASIAERFNIGKNDLRASGFDANGGALANIKALDKVLNQYGYTSEYVNEVNQSGAAQWDMLQSNIGNALKKSGTEAMNLLKGPLEKVNQWMGAGGLSKITSVLSNGIAGVVRFAINAGTNILNFVQRVTPKVKDMAASVGAWWQDVAPKIQALWDQIQPVVSLIADKLVSGLQALWPEIVNIAQGIADTAKSFVQWDGFLPVVAGLAAGILTFKAYTLATTIAVKAWTIATKIHTMWTQRATLAQKLFNLATKANVIGLIITALVALGVALFVAYKKSETFRKFVDGMWSGIKTATMAVLNFFKVTVPKYFMMAFNAVTNFLKNWGLVILGVIGGPIFLIAALVYKYWDQIKAVTISVFTAIGSWLGSVWGSIKSTVSGVAVAIWNKVTAAWNGLKTAISSAMEGIKSTMSSAWDSIVSAVSGVGEGIKSKLSGAWEAVKSTFLSGINWIIGKFNGMISSLNSVSIKNPFTGSEIAGVNIPLIPTIDGSHKNGLASVPWDGYVAELHKGERVLTANENKVYTPESAPARSASGSTGRVTVSPSINITVEGNADSGTVSSLKTTIHNEVLEIIMSALRSAGLDGA